MPESRTPKPDFDRAFGEAKKQAVGVASDASDAAQDFMNGLPTMLPTLLILRHGPRVGLLGLSSVQFAIQSRTSRIPRF